MSGADLAAVAPGDTAADATVLVPHAQLYELCSRAAVAAGANDGLAEVLARATVDAERRGRPNVGVTHLFDAIQALSIGAMNPDPSPAVSLTRSAFVTARADNGPAHLAYDRARSLFLSAADHAGLAMLGISGSSSWGELSYYTVDAAAHGLLAFAGCNSRALMSVYDSVVPATGTNPLSFALPSRATPRLIDQASSEGAWVRVRDAQARGQVLPEGWAVDADGHPTTDPAAALGGALLPFGGVKGANIAMLVETLAVLVGGAFCIDAGGPDEPGDIGTWMIAIDPTVFRPGFVDLIDNHFDRLQSVIGHDFGRRREPLNDITLADGTYRQLAAAGSAVRGYAPAGAAHGRS